MKKIRKTDVRPIKDLRDLLQQACSLYGSKNAFYIKDDSQNYKGITYNEFKNDVDALGTAFLNRGLKDKFIAVMSENRYEWCVTYLATANGVGVIVPLDKELPTSELENLLKRSNASAIVYSGKHHEQLVEISPNVSHIKYFINMDIDKHIDDSFLSLKALIAEGKELLNSGNSDYLNATVDENEMRFLIFTSGTTDLAKGVMLSHKNICTDIVAVVSALYIDSTDSILSILPLHHTYACTVDFLTFIYIGGCVSFNEGLKHIPKNLKETKPSILILVPLIIENMYQKIWAQASKDWKLKLKLKLGLFVSGFLYKCLKIDVRRKIFKEVIDNFGGRIRLIIAGAAAIDPEVIRGLQNMGILTLQGYGLTEASPIVSVNREEKNKDNSIGLPLPGVEVKIVNPDNEGNGEIIVRGGNVMLGYYQNEEATKKVLKDGWLYTGDLGKMDEEGFLYITGRKKNVIVTKNGKNIFPEEVESYINKSPYIKESLVTGKDDDEKNETIVTAQIVIDLENIKAKLNNPNPSQEDIYKLIKSEIKQINKNMPLYKRIQDFTIRENEFAKTTTKKIKRYLEKQ